MSVKTILAVGSIALDTLETPSGRRADILGGSATYFSVAASLFAKVNLVGVVGADFPDEGWRLFKERGIGIDDVQQAAGKTFRWGGRYSSDLSRRDTLFTELGVFEDFQPRISNHHKQMDLAYLGNIQPSLQLAVCAELPPECTIVSDTMNLWIEHNRDDLQKVLQKSDIFLLNDEEAQQLTGHEQLDDAAKVLLAEGPSIVIIKLGQAGALIAQGEKHQHVPVYPKATAVDPTGAGDSFAGGLLGFMARHGSDNIVEAVVTAAATASFTVEGLGLEGLLPATPERVASRVDAIHAVMDQGFLRHRERL